MADLKRLQLAVEVGDRETAVEVTQQAIDEAIPPKTVLDAMTDAMGVVGQRFATNEIYVPEMLISARAMKAAVALLEPLLVGSGYVAESVAIMGTIKGDLHDIGKNLVALMLRAGGFTVTDIGIDVPPERFVEAAKESDADIVAISLLMSVCLDEVEQACELIRRSGIRAKTLVGGPPVSDEVAAAIGADMYGGFDAVTALQSARELMSRIRTAA